jgi:hypothetical protein
VPPASIQDLRLLLRNKFPQAHAARLDEPPPVETRLRFSDPATFPAGALSEIVPEGSAPVLGLIVSEILGAPEKAADFPEILLIDADHFDPASYPPEACSRLFWVRCHQALTLLKAADLLLRDGNISFLLLDLTGFPARDLRSLPASSWWRLKQLAGNTAARVLILSSVPIIPCADLRLTLSTDLTLDAFELPRADLIREIRSHTRRLRRAT